VRGCDADELSQRTQDASAQLQQYRFVERDAAKNLKRESESFAATSEADLHPS
jgi:hypothetical protein